jgi:hypothetical protein
LEFTGGLVPLVGAHAAHPRLRNSEAFGLAYSRLSEADRQRCLARAAAVPGVVTADRLEPAP